MCFGMPEGTDEWILGHGCQFLPPPFPPKLFVKNMTITLNVPLFLSESSLMHGMTGLKKNHCCPTLNFCCCLQEVNHRSCTLRDTNFSSLNCYDLKQRFRFSQLFSNFPKPYPSCLPFTSHQNYVQLSYPWPMKSGKKSMASLVMFWHRDFLAVFIWFYPPAMKTAGLYWKYSIEIFNYNTETN